MQIKSKKNKKIFQCESRSKSGFRKTLISEPKIYMFYNSFSPIQNADFLENVKKN